MEASKRVIEKPLAYGHYGDLCEVQILTRSTRKEAEMETVDFIISICYTIVVMYVGFRIGREWKD